MEEKVRKQFTFSGEVQGVGFRYRTQYAASACGVTGWVKNEWDGTVTMEAQGTEKALNEMFKLIGESRYIHISDMNQKELPLEEFEYGFHIR
ncbi:MAG: acylphosphatase [Agathobacter sp.]